MLAKAEPLPAPTVKRPAIRYPGEGGTLPEPTVKRTAPSVIPAKAGTHELGAWGWR
jgi:hypothetical protein